MGLAWLRPAGAQAVNDLEKQRRSRGSPDKSAVGTTIKISDPDAEHVMIENGNRPGVVKAMGGAGFPKYGIGMHGVGAVQFGSWDVAQHFQREKCCFGGKDPPALRDRLG